METRFNLRRRAQAPGRPPAISCQELKPSRHHAEDKRHRRNQPLHTLAHTDGVTLDRRGRAWRTLHTFAHSDLVRVSSRRAGDTSIVSPALHIEPWSTGSTHFCDRIVPPPRETGAVAD
eukprot:756662-Hanusia_phi.AAC.2